MKKKKKNNTIAALDFSILAGSEKCKATCGGMVCVCGVCLRFIFVYKEEEEEEEEQFNFKQRLVHPSHTKLTW